MKFKPIPVLASLAALVGPSARADFYYGGYDTSTGYYQASGTASVSDKSYSNSDSDANAVQVRGGSFTMLGCTVTKTGDTATSQNSDDTSFYGVNSAVFAGNSSTSTSAVVAMTNGTVSTSAKGANAFFAYGGGVLYLDSIAVTNTARASRGLIATGGGTIYATNMDIETQEETSSVIATDRGGGTVTVDGGNYFAKGNKCAIIYSAGAMSAYNANGGSASGEIAVIEGDNSVVISNCTFYSGSSSRGLLLMQSGSGDASGTTPVMTITDSTLTMTDSSAPLVEVATCVTADVTLDNVSLTVPSGVLMAVMEDSQWSTSGAVGNLTLKNGDYTGTVTVDSGYTGNVTVESTATWTLTADTTVDTLVNNGTIVTGAYTLSYTTLSGSGTITTESSGGSDTGDDSGSGTGDDSGSDTGDDSGSGSGDTSTSALADETGILDDRPELLAFPFQEAVMAAGTYTASTVGTNFVLSGTISGDVAITATETCRVTLDDLAMTGVLAITGDAQLWLVGENAIAATGPSAVTCTGTLTIGGPGSLAASAPGAKKTGVVAGADLVVAGGTTTLTIDSPTAKNACGVSLSGNYTQLAGTLAVVGASGDVKQNGVFLSKKKTAATISGGVLDIALAGEKSVGLALDKETASATLSGGVIRLAMSGDGAKGIKGDGSFTMTGGAIDAEITGGYVEELFEYEDGDGNAWNYYVTLTSSTKTSGDSSQGSSSLAVATSKLVANGTYAVYDPSKAYAVKVGTLDVSGGLVRIRCTGTCGRGMGADSMYLSGGVFDISVAGGPTDVYVESLVDADDLDDTTFTNGVVTTCLDAGGAACIKTSGESGVLSITGGTFELLATGDAGKIINAGGYLILGEEGSTTLPTDSAFSPDIQGRVYGSKIYCTYYKQKYYGSLATAVATTNLSSMTCSVAADNVVTGSGDDVDYSNAKGVKAKTDVTVNGGRLRIYTANDGGEGLESKSAMTINGGVLEFNCADDCLNTAGDLTINGGYLYAASTGNDAIDSNANITVNGGWIYAFTLSNPEEAFDVNSGYSVTINGGYLFGVGAAQSCRDGTLAGTQGYYQGSQTLSTSATYWYANGTKTVYGKIPAAASSTSAYLFVSVPGMTSGTAPTSYGTSAPSGATSVGFHGFYTK
ncbi:MAG: carbohydrate-binding domain-containing protein [Kiritimatiellae bacterium]|nr:carbohydrate-binding domain-containing protein [Kiritimatiellia bacterium]